MGDKWPKIRLGNCCNKIGSGATPRGGSEVYQTSGIALIRSQNIYNDAFKKDGLAYISDKHARELENVIVQKDDVLLNITGDSVARVCQAPKEVLPARVNQHVAIIRPKEDILDATYLRYFLVTPSMQNYMHALASSGATRQALTKSMIEEFNIPAPPLPEQKAIASILGALDDKIELNRKMNETLEAMARAIFKSWFVDFLPVRAKMAAALPVRCTQTGNKHVPSLPAAKEGRWFVYALECEDGSFYIGHTEDLQQRWQQHVYGKGAQWTKTHPPIRIAYFETLSSQQEAVKREQWLKTGFGRKWFKRQVVANARTQTCDPIPLPAPNEARQAGGLGSHKEWQDSPIGKIPKGWTISTIEDLAERVAMGPFGSSIKVSTFVSHGVPVISGQHLHGTMLHDEAYNFISLEHAEKLKNANVFRGDVIFTHAGNIGQVAYIPSNSQYDCYVLSQRQFYMRCNPSKVTPSFIVYYFKSREGQYKLLANTSTTGVPSISRPVTYLRSIQIPVPPKVVMDEFEKFVKPIHLQIQSNIIQSNTLSTMRDALLPKLLSGEIRVKDN